MVLFKSNRTAKSLLILIPTVISYLLWVLFKLIFSIPSSQAAMFDMMLLSFVIGIAILCLLTHKRTRKNRFVTLLLAIAVMSVVSIISSLSFFGFQLSQESIVWIVFLEIISLAAALAFVITGWICRKYYSPLRFISWLGLWSIISCLAAMLLYAILITVVMSGGSSLEQLLGLMMRILIIGLVIGVLLYAILLPFVILITTNFFYRWPFFECFRLKGMVLSPSERERAGLPPETTSSSGDIKQTEDWRK